MTLDEIDTFANSNSGMIEKAKRYEQDVKFLLSCINSMCDYKNKYYELVVQKNTNEDFVSAIKKLYGQHFSNEWIANAP